MYTVSLPPRLLEFNQSIIYEGYHKELEVVHNEGTSLFNEIAESLNKLKSKFDGSAPSFPGSSLHLPDIEEMLHQDKSYFENQYEMRKNENGDNLLGLNRLYWELLLESCIWERRLNLPLLQKNDSVVESNENSIRRFLNMQFSEISEECKKRLEKGILPNLVSEGTRELMKEERQKLHIPLQDDGRIVRDYLDEHSSIISCALAVVHNNPALLNFSTASSNSSPKDSADTYFFYSISIISQEESCPSSFDFFNSIRSPVPGDDNSSLQVSLHVAKSEEKAKYSVVCLYAKRFNDLRRLCCPSEAAYIASLARSKPWAAKGGKSMSSFAKTMDERLITKKIYKTEYDSFSGFASKYFHHMGQSLELGSPTCLAKILGIYQVSIRENESVKSHYLMVMENLSYNQTIAYHYDLKGAPLRRDIYSSGVDHGSNEVRLDGLFVDDMKSSPLYLTTDAKRHLEEAVLNDLTFLDSTNVMDYSLLVGVGMEKQVLACGIIDYLRQYNIRYRNFISPKDYQNRFRKFITQHLLKNPEIE